MKYQDILNFWFQDLTPQQWFTKNATLDQLIIKKFQKIHNKAINAELFEWRKSSKGRLAEIIILDQFSRNIYREKKESFLYDSMALALAQEAIFQQTDQELNIQEKSFLYMPYMHSESIAIHKKAIELFSQPGLEKTLEFEYKHKTIIDRFGRYPHRNNVLQRISTQEEINFLKEDGSSF
ncbi:MAG: DUF924 domain-containing protein [Bacteriovoracaceae bacterium]|nr:DUF924 domain-containing protein [Bacteriovoracaceae bacterium]